MPNRFFPGGGGGGGVAGVSSFNSRVGVVNPQAGDYTAAQVGAVPTSQKGAAGGVATLDGGGNVPLAQLGNAPSAAVSSVFGRAGGVTAQAGDYTAAQVGAVATSAVAAANGVASLDGGGNVPAGQLGNAVRSFNGRTGIVVPQAGDYTAAQVSAVPTSAEGAANGVATLDNTGNVPLAQLGYALTNPMIAVGDMIVGGASGVATRRAIGATGNVWTVVGGTGQWAAPGGTSTTLGPASAYILYNDGTTFHIVLWITGVDAYHTTVAATIANNLGTLLNGSTPGNPIAVYVDPSCNLSGTSWTTYGSNYTIIGLSGGQQSANPNAAPNLGSVTLGASGQNSVMGGIKFSDVTFETETLSDYWAITDINHENCSYRGVNTNMIVIDNTHPGGGTANTEGIQYLRWAGVTSIALSTSAATQDFFKVIGPGGTGSTASLGHSHFDYIQQVGMGNPSTGTWSLFHFTNGCKWHRVEVDVIDLNTNQAANSTTPTLVQFDGGNSGNITQCPAIYFGAIHWEQHQTFGNPALVTVGNFTAGGVWATIFVNSLWVNTHTISLLQNASAPSFFSNTNGFFLDVRSIVADAAVGGGTWNEGTQNPVRVGPCNAQVSPLNSGDFISGPGSNAIVSNGVLSLMGSGVFVLGTTYTVGGTKLGVLLNGTTTIVSADGTILVNAQPLTNQIMSLEPGMTLKVNAGGTIPTFWKGE